jgi:hypothetical protein
MGMFDEIVVPKSYLRNLINKEEEMLFRKDHVFQTKDFENVMDLYKVSGQQLYKLDRSEFLLEEGVQHTKLTEKWNKVNDNVSINFYDNVTDKKGDRYWMEFEFAFLNGKIDKKDLISLKLDATKEEINDIENMWDTEQEILDKYRLNSFSYRFFSWLETRLNKITNWARKKHSIPLEIRKKAYEKSGRLKIDPDCLKMYDDN